MTPTEVLDEFRAAGALLEGHFVLTSGLHSSVFLQKMFVFMDPARTERLCRALAEKIRERFGAVDLVVSPAVGGIVPGYETARHLGAKAIFVERENGAFTLRRGFAIPEGARVVMVEDIVTTGLSLDFVVRGLRARDPATLDVCVLFDKRERRLVDVPIRYTGFPIPNDFVVGYGLDYAERYRNLPYVAALTLDGLGNA